MAKEERINALMRGSLALGMVFSTAAGIVFAMLFYNVAQYVNASAVVKEAARKAIRCVSATDPREACQIVNVDAPSGQPEEWFGYRSKNGDSVSPRPPEVSYYSYQASLPTLRWGADFKTYLIHEERNQLSYAYSEIPERTFIARYREPNYRVSSSFEATYFVPDYGDFPDFEQDETSNFAQWQRHQNHKYIEIPFPWKYIADDNYTIFMTAPIPVPELEGAGDEPVLCVGIDGKPNGAGCDIGPLAGAEEDTGDNNNKNDEDKEVDKKRWKRKAFVALKVFGEAYRINGSPSVEWGNGEPISNGLYVRTFEPDGSRSEFRALGGRAPVKVISKSEDTAQGYNLWLRGPSGAHGGNEKWRHEKIKVTRGGKFQVMALMASNGGDIRAKASIAYYFDSYQRNTARKRCLTDDVPGPKDEILCPDINTCGAATCETEGYCPDNEYSWRAKGCDIDLKKESVNCEERAQAETIGGEFSSVNLGSYFVCDSSWRPDAPDFSSEGRCFSNWEVEDSGSSAKVPGVSGSCMLAHSARSRNETCQYFATVGRKSKEACGAVFSEIEGIEAQAAALEADPPKGIKCKKSGKCFQKEVSVSWGRPVAKRTVFSWSPYDEDGTRLSSGQFEEVSSSVSEESFISNFKRQGVEQDAPRASEFLSSISKEIGASQGQRGWSEFVNGLEEFVSVVNKGAGEAVAVTSVYPFTEAVPEIYWGQSALGRGWDFDRDCIVDAECEGAYQKYDSEEQMLRSYAAEEVPQAGDTSYSFTAKKTLKYVKVYNEVETLEQAKAISLPVCTPVKMICENYATEDWELVSLGAYSGTPPQCLDETYRDCFSEPAETDYEQWTDNNRVDESVVLEVARAEIQRILPYVKAGEECDAGDSVACASVTVQYPDDERALVTVGYEMPLTFPLNTILGRETLAIRETKEEILERMLLSK